MAKSGRSCPYSPSALEPFFDNRLLFNRSDSRTLLYYNDSIQGYKSDFAVDFHILFEESGQGCQLLFPLMIYHFSLEKSFSFMGLEPPLLLRAKRSGKTFPGPIFGSGSSIRENSSSHEEVGVQF